MSKKIISLVLIGIAIAFLTGFSLAKSLAPDLALVKESIVDDLRQKLDSKIEKGLIPMFVAFTEEIALTSSSGELVKIEENILEVKVENSYRGQDLLDYLNQPDFYLKKVKIDKETKIVQRELKESEQLMKETKEARPESPPEPFVETEISVKDLKEGMSVSVEAKSEFKLEEEKVIEAAKIVVTK